MVDADQQGLPVRPVPHGDWEICHRVHQAEVRGLLRVPRTLAAATLLTIELPTIARGWPPTCDPHVDGSAL
eukprot:8059386-Alexandrium_andersonii.AAC.1